MIRNVLLPLDGSTSSTHALNIACSFAALTKAKLTGLFIEDERLFYELPLGNAIAENFTGNPLISAPLPPDEMLAAEENIEARARTVFETFETVCKAQGVVGQFVTFRGDPLTILVQRARAADFVILGNPGVEEAEGFRAILPGLLRETTRPVLVVGEGSLPHSAMVIAYDGSRGADRALCVAAEYGELHGTANMHVLTVSNDPESAKTIQTPAHEYLSSYSFALTDMWIAGKPADAIKDYALSVGAGVVVMGAFGSNRLTELIFGSTTQKLLEERRLALLVVP